MITLRMFWRALFGSGPEVGLYEFDEDKPAWDPPARVEVLERDGEWVRYRFVRACGTNLTEDRDRSMKASAFRFCYRKPPSQNASVE